MSDFDFRTKRWEWGGDRPDLMEKEPKYRHAFFVPGLGWFGGFPEEVARYIVSLQNQRSLAAQRHWQ